MPATPAVAVSRAVLGINYLKPTDAVLAVPSTLPLRKRRRVLGRDAPLKT